MLAELSELGLSLARDLHARALAAETTQDAEKLALAFQRVSRGVRQTFALELKIERARNEDDREAARQERLRAADPGDQDEAPLDPEVAALRARFGERFSRVRGALNRLLWDEAEGCEDEFEVLSEDLENRLDEAARRADFLDIPFETLVRQLKADMDLSGTLTLTACEPPQGGPSLANGHDLTFDVAPPNTG